jgi:hypothetical protein
LIYFLKVHLTDYEKNWIDRFLAWCLGFHRKKIFILLP